jgi:hypothetical protein
VTLILRGSLANAGAFFVSAAFITMGLDPHTGIDQWWV